MTGRIWNGSDAAYSTEIDWSPTGVPVAGDNASIGSGMVTISGSDLAPNVSLQFGTSGSSLVLTLANAVIASNDRLDVAGDTPNVATVLASGAVINDGSVNFYDGSSRSAVPTAVLSIGALGGIGGTFTNNGMMVLTSYRPLIDSADANAGDQLVNDGTIELLNLYSYPSRGTTPNNSVVTVPITGTGAITLEPSTGLEFGASVAAGQTVSFNAVSSNPDPSGSFRETVTIDALSVFAASIGRFNSSEDVISVAGPSYDSTQVLSYGGLSTLAFLAAGQVVASLNFQGSFSPSQLILSGSPASGGQEQTTINFDTTAAGPPRSVSVYRFFDTADGAHFFTADAGEAATLRSTRPDLVAEGVGFDAVNPAAHDPNAVPVYRFFDQGDGTHFFTASASERDALIASRPDLVYEPNSTFYEHSSPFHGDLAVFRFFDTINGSHFYDDNANEVATLATTRPDLVNEGIAFYAPSS